MFEQFSERARHVVVLAQEEARDYRHGYLGTEHILLGLLREKEGLAARVLQSFGMTVERVRAQVLRIVGTGERGDAGQVPFTPRAKKVLELSLREALSLGVTHIGTEHILLGLIHEHEGVAARILLDFDADPDIVRNELIALLSGTETAHQIRGLIGTQRVLIDASWFDQLTLMLDQLALDIRRGLRRPPDSGDLLMVLACVDETTGGRALRELGLDLGALKQAIDHVRSDREAKLGEQAEKIRRAKEAAIESNDFEAAARLRDHERRLSMGLCELGEAGPEALDEIRRLLGIVPPAAPPESPSESN